MAKSDQKNVQNRIYQQSDNATKDFGNFQSGLTTPINETWNRGSQDYEAARSGYTSFQNNGGISPEDAARLRSSFSGGGGGGISNPLSGRSSNFAGLSSAFANAYRPDYTEANTGFRDLSSASGGFDVSKLGQIYGNTDQLSEIGRTGGITTDDYNNVNRQSLLDQERTGGYSDKDIQNIRARAAASAPAMFSAVKDQMDQGRRITGNLAGASSTNFKLARQAAQQQNQDRLNSEIGLAESIRAGKADAGKFLSGQNLNLTGLRTGNQISGASAAGSLGLGTQQALTANRLAGLRGLQDSETNMGQWGLGQASGLDSFGLSKAGALDSWDMNNAQLDMSAASANASAARASAADQAELEKWMLTYGNANKQWATEGLDNLYNTNLNANMGYNGMRLDGLNSQYGNQANLLNLAAQNRGRTAMENVQGIAGAVGGGLGVLTGLGGGGGTTSGYRVGGGNPYSGVASPAADTRFMY